MLSKLVCMGETVFFLCSDRTQIILKVHLKWILPFSWAGEYWWILSKFLLTVQCMVYETLESPQGLCAAYIFLYHLCAQWLEIDFREILVKTWLELYVKCHFYGGALLLNILRYGTYIEAHLITHKPAVPTIIGQQLFLQVTQKCI